MKDIKKEIVKIALVNDKREILLQLRDNNPSLIFPDYWVFIGGGVEVWEKKEEAIKREIREEINESVTNIVFLKTEKYPNGDTIHYFMGKIKARAKDIHLTEGQEVRYFKFEELANLKIPLELRVFIQKNKKQIFK